MNESLSVCVYVCARARAPSSSLCMICVFLWLCVCMCVRALSPSVCALSLYVCVWMDGCSLFPLPGVHKNVMNNSNYIYRHLHTSI